MKVRDWMSSEVASVRRNDQLVIADDLMRRVAEGLERT